MSDRVAEVVAAYLATTEDASLDELLAEVRRRGGRGVGRAAVQRVLAGDARFEAIDVLGRQRWSLGEGAGSGAGSDARTEIGAYPGEEVADEAGTADDRSDDRSRATRDALTGLDLRPWQAEALAAWSTTCRGVVEAVTGTGKTRLALAAIRTVLDRQGRVLVLVPTLELLDQWRAGLRATMPHVPVGRLGGGGQDDLFSHPVLLATPHSAAEVPIDLPPGVAGLVVADEAHRYGAPTWGRALPEAFGLRLALTATYERGDEGVAEVLEPYFGPVVFRYRYDRAVAEGTVAPFSLALAGVALDERERRAHDAADARVRSLHRELVGGLGMPREPGALLRAVAAVVADAGDAGGDGRQAAACREYLLRLRQRREITATATGKLDVAASAAPALIGGRSLVFTDTVAQAEDAARVLVAAGVGAETVHGQLGDDRRRIRLAQFRRGRIDALVAPRVLDEGIDVPDADIAIVLAAFRTRRQLIQRLGRVLRLKSDGRHARLVLAHATDTAEDPDRGGHRDFLEEVRGVAERIDRLEVTSGSGVVAEWLQG